MIYINIHTHKPSNSSNTLEIRNLFHTQISLPEKKPGNFFSIGIHPWHTKGIDLEKEISTLKKTARLENIIAIGECGIDKVEGAALDEQTIIFKAQALIAEELKKPMIIHCVKAYQEMISIRQVMNPSVPWIIHGFNKNEQTARQLIKAGFFLSFGTSLFGISNLSRLFTSLPNDTLFLETDEESGSKLKFLYEFAAKTKNISTGEFNEIIKYNFKQSFKINANDWIK